MNISAVIVTKGDVDLSPVLASLPFDDIVVWDNSKEQDYKVYGRYVAMKRAKYSIIYSQDDDAITQPERICKHYMPGVITANLPIPRRVEYPDGITLLGWGSVFDKSLTGVFAKYLRRWPMDELFLRECDRVFTGLNRTWNITLPFEHLPQAFTDDRMGQEKRHLSDLQEIRNRLASIR